MPELVWEDIEDAIFDWVQVASGVADENVLWAEQDTNQPTGDYFDLRISSQKPQGQAELKTSLVSPAPEEVEGEITPDIEVEAKSQLEFTVSVRAFYTSKVGETTALTKLRRVQKALDLPSVRAGMAEVGIIPFDHGQVQNVSAVAGADFESRAMLEVRFRGGDSISEFTTYIKKVTLEDRVGIDDPEEAGREFVVEAPEEPEPS